VLQDTLLTVRGVTAIGLCKTIICEWTGHIYECTFVGSSYKQTIFFNAWIWNI